MSIARASVEIGRASLRVVRANPRLLWFPALCQLAVIAVALVLLGPLVEGFGFADVLGIAEEDSLPWWVALSFYAAIHAVIAFFGVGLTHQALRALGGHTVSVAAGLRYSASRVSAIGGLALIHATLGMVLSLGAGTRRAARSLFGTLWDLVTYLALPVMVQEGRGPIGSLRRSGRLFKETWGETAVAEIAFRMIMVQFIVLVVVLCLLLASWFEHPEVPVLFVAFVLGLGFSFFLNTLQAIYRAALYIFAAEGVVPDAFDTPEMNDVWKVK